jgi:hypothetical protein
MPAAGRIFISYRREDSAGYAGRLSDALEARFGAGRVFRDVDDISPGEDFVQRLDTALADCAVLLAVIGRQWATVTDSRGGRRLDDPQDYVRVEIATALQREDLRVVPVLVDGAPMPSPADLPDQLAALSRRQAVSLADGSWGDDVARLCRAIEEDVQPEMAAAARAARAARRRRKILALAGAATLVVLAGGGWLLLRAPDVSGAWRLADGSRWMVQQSGRDLQIEEVHVDTNEVWRKGTGRLRGDLLEVKLQYVFERRMHLQGELRLAPGRRAISGILVETPGGRRVDFELRR